MRKNVQEVFKAWHNGRPLNKQSINTDGEVIKSYRTIILHWEGDAVILNTKPYSRTTSNQQKSLHQLLREGNINFTVSS